MADRYATSQAKAAAKLINAMASPATYFKAGTVGRPVRVASRRVAPTDTEIINAYGIGARIVTVAADAIKPDAPAQFDRFELLGELYTIDAVAPNYRDELLVSFTCYCMGQKQ
jgi:hypothetical protein